MEHRTTVWLQEQGQEQGPMKKRSEPFPGGPLNWGKIRAHRVTLNIWQYWFYTNYTESPYFHFEERQA